LREATPPAHDEAEREQRERERARGVAARAAAAAVVIATTATFGLARRGAAIAVGRVAVVARLVGVDRAVAAAGGRCAGDHEADVVHRPAAELEALVADELELELDLAGRRVLREVDVLEPPLLVGVVDLVVRRHPLAGLVLPDDLV